MMSYAESDGTNGPWEDPLYRPSSSCLIYPEAAATCCWHYDKLTNNGTIINSLVEQRGLAIVH